MSLAFGREPGCVAAREAVFARLVARRDAAIDAWSDPRPPTPVLDLAIAIVRGEHISLSPPARLVLVLFDAAVEAQMLADAADPPPLLLVQVRDAALALLIDAARIAAD